MSILSRNHLIIRFLFYICAHVHNFPFLKTDIDHLIMEGTIRVNDFNFGQEVSHIIQFSKDAIRVVRTQETASLKSDTISTIPVRRWPVLYIDRHLDWAGHLIK